MLASQPKRPCLFFSVRLGGASRDPTGSCPRIMGLPYWFLRNICAFVVRLVWESDGRGCAGEGSGARRAWRCDDGPP